MKRLRMLLLTALFTAALSVCALAAGDVTISKDTTLTNFANVYHDLTIEAGVTLTTQYYKPDPQGIEISGTLTVKDGARITGGGILIFGKDANAAGLDLYYLVQGRERPIPVPLPEFFALLGVTDYKPSFRRSETTGHWVLEGQGFEHDPYPDPTQPQVGEAAQIAHRLRALGLFKGVGTNADGSVNYDLGRPATRVEAIVILIRLLGKEADALSGTWDCPFDDVPAWAECYIGYAYQNGLTKGVSATEFGTSDATGEQFMTFVLRALNYSDAAGDFDWRTPQTLADQLGIMPRRGSLENFARADAVEVCESALRAHRNNDRVLYQRLILEGVFTQEQYDAVMGGR